MEFEQYSKSHICLLVSDVSIKMNHYCTDSLNSSDSDQHKYSEKKKEEEGTQIYSGNVMYFFFIGEKRESTDSSELNAFFKVELNFVQNPPGGRHY